MWIMGGDDLVSAVLLGLIALSAVAVWWLLRRPRPRDNRRLSGREAYARMIARGKRGRR